MQDKLYCKNPWNCLELNNDGKCFFCNPCFSNFHLIGNIFENDINEIWNGEKAQQYRQDILDKKYTYCNYDNCNGNKVAELPFDGVIAPYPEYVNVGYDYTCGQRCIVCRDEFKALPTEECQMWEEKLETHILPITSKAKYIFVNCRGEFFDSNHTQKMVAAILKNNPNIKVDFISNGIKCTEKNLIKHNLLGKIFRIHISLHAATRKTYKKIFRNDKFDDVMKNVRHISELKKSGQIEDFEIMFVITNENYKEMPAFVKLAEELDARAAFSACIGGFTEYTTNREEYAVFYQNHHNYNDFVKILKNPIFKSEHCSLPAYLRELTPVPKKQMFINQLRFFERKFLRMHLEQSKEHIHIFSHDIYK